MCFVNKKWILWLEKYYIYCKMKLLKQNTCTYAKSNNCKSEKKIVC